MEITEVLPEDCMSLIVSLTSPRDACRMALVSQAFKSVADSDAVWEMFLPVDYNDIVSETPSPFLSLSLQKKDLYFSLCDHPILIDNGAMTIQLERKDGRKCYMVGARSLSIHCSDSPDAWSWIYLPDSRFTRVAKLENVGWLYAKGKFKLKTLSAQTHYAAYLVFKLATDRYGFRHTPVELHVTIDGMSTGEVRSVILDPPRNVPKQTKERADGWLEIEMGEFFNDFRDDSTVECILREDHNNRLKRGLIIQGIELRPTYNRSTLCRISTTQMSKLDRILRYGQMFAKSIITRTLS